MKGVVTVRRNGEVLYKEDNLIVDGAAETLVDILTAPPHTSGDLSSVFNYVVRGVTMGTTQAAYAANMHAYKLHNLVRGSEVVDYWRTTGTGQMFDMEGYFNIAAGAPDDAIKTPLISSYLEEGLQGDPISFEVDLRYDYQLPIASATDGSSYTTVSGNVWGNEVAINLRWDASGVPTLVDEQHGYIKKLANDWYRICLVPGTLTSNTTELEFGIVITGDANHNSLITAGGAYGRLDMRRPAMHVGSVPVNYYMSSTTDEFTFASEEDTFPLIASSVVNADRHGMFFLSGPGTVTSDLSAYNVIASYPTNPTPYDTKGQEITRTPYETATSLSLPQGHNLGLSIYEGSIPSTPIHNYVEGWTAGTDLSSQVVHADMRWISGYPPSDITYNMVSSLDSYDDPMTTLTHSNTAVLADTESVDQEGYIKVAYPRFFTGSTPTYAGGTTGHVKVSYDPVNFSSTGEIDYTITLNPGDRRWADLMGGVFTLGLHVPGWRMIAKKVFNFPLTFLPDEGTTPGASDERDLEITWTLRVIE